MKFSPNKCAVSKDQVIKMPVSKATANTPNPTLELTDYPFEIVLDAIPSEEILEKIYSEGFSNLPDIETTEAELLAKLHLIGSMPTLLRAGQELRMYEHENGGFDGKKLQKYKVRPFLNQLSKLD